MKASLSPQDSLILKQLEHNMKAKFAYIPNALSSMVVRRTQGSLIINSHLSSDMFNIICSEGELTSKEITQTLDYFRKQSLPAAWWVGFSDEHCSLKGKLEELGLKAEEAELTMAADLLSWQPIEAHSELKVVNVESISVLEDFIQVLSDLMPDERSAIKAYFTRAAHLLLHPESRLKLLVGYADKRPVATSSVFLAEEVAGIFDVITLPVARGQGVAKTMTTAAMKEGHAHGYAIATLGATDDAHFVYEKLGFRALSSMAVYPFS